ncbi:hypothetical protein BaRGS_00028971 [Batillaria attramentaria]|uniref:J domain-containing protein n=1 Tax=Batillaria attramentaria TaxID=370345 RepID=A0ABD0JYS5_9CAEN
MSSTQTLSESSRLRELGNEAYRRVTDDVSPSVQLVGLQQALNSYDKALAKATNDTDRSSACKNMAMTNWKMAKAKVALDSDRQVVTLYFRDALRCFRDAREYGTGRTWEWLDNLASAGIRCWDDFRERVEQLPYENRIRELERLVGYIVDDVTMAREYLEIANTYFNSSVMALGERNYRQSLNLLAECGFPLNEARRLFSRDPSHMRECELLEEDIFIQTCVAESIQARMSGEELLVLVTQNEEDLNIDMVWEVVDWFRRAAMLTREHDLEQEVLKMKDRAKKCLTRVLELANTMEDVDKLTKKFNEATKIEFLKFVYTTYPPKDKRHKLGDVPDDTERYEVQKLYRKAAIHYHPDRVKEDEHGVEWKALTGEITKLITSHYEYFKGLDDKVKDEKDEN